MGLLGTLAEVGDSDNYSQLGKLGGLEGGRAGSKGIRTGAPCVVDPHNCRYSRQAERPLPYAQRMGNFHFHSRSGVATTTTNLGRKGKAWKIQFQTHTLNLKFWWEILKKWPKTAIFKEKLTLGAIFDSFYHASASRPILGGRIHLNLYIHTRN